MTTAHLWLSRHHPLHSLRTTSRRPRPWVLSISAVKTRCFAAQSKQAAPTMTTVAAGAKGGWERGRGGATPGGGGGGAGGGGGG